MELDPFSFNIALVALTILAVAVSSITLMGWLTIYITNFSLVLDIFEAKRSEFTILSKVVDECHSIVSGPVRVTDHVTEVLIDASDKRDSLSARFSNLTRHNAVVRRVRILLYQMELDKDLATFRDSVILLRDLCSEIRLRQQLIEMSAAMARLTELAMPEVGDDDAESKYAASVAESEDGAEPGVLLPRSTKWGLVQHHKNSAQQAWQKYLHQLEAQQFNINVTVAVPQAGGIRYHGTKAQLDTASDVDFVSLEYLKKAAKYPDGSLVPILAEDQQTVMGIGNNTYTPQFKIKLSWCPEGRQKYRDTWFMVVEKAEFDMLLGSSRFAEAAAELVNVAWPLFRRHKNKATMQKELAQEKQRLEEARTKERAEFEAERARRNLPLGRASTVASGHGAEEVDLELGMPRIGTEIDVGVGELENK
ncbi:hypothetical protein QBC44DRAFT_370376 [Cladorrhinum sp. PSN332]|nr:hypothetical protein QBC44DRAFT_370376 [Cladorrhinum sp. PSN332]